MERKGPELPILNDSEGQRRALSRRQVAQLLLTGAAGAAFPALSDAHPIHKHLANPTTMAAADTKAAAAKWSPEFLSAHQDQTLMVLAERIIPGSSRAQVNRFIDLLLSADSRETQQRFLNSLAAFDAEPLKRFQRPFRALSETQQNELLTVASTEESGRPRERRGVRAPDSSREPVTLTLRDHFENLKGWIRGAYYSSEVGMRELGWKGEVFYESFPGCQHPGGHS